LTKNIISDIVIVENKLDQIKSDKLSARFRKFFLKAKCFR